MSDNINHPSHYADSCSIECIDAMELIFGQEELAVYCVINAFKYMWRWKNKNGYEDLAKAEWYLDKYKSLTDNRKSKRVEKLFDMLDKFKEGGS